jgi:hypothetical protein
VGFLLAAGRFLLKARPWFLLSDLPLSEEQLLRGANGARSPRLPFLLTALARTP